MSEQGFAGNKKALSDLFAILIILIVGIAGLMIVYGLVIKIAEPTLAPKFSCFDLQTREIIKIEKSCYNASSKDIEVLIVRNSEEYAINEFDFVINDGESSTWGCDDNCGCSVLNAGERKKYFVYNEKKPESVDLIVGGCKLPGNIVNEC